MSKRRRGSLKISLKYKVDLTGWVVDEWSAEVEKLVTVDTDKAGVNFSLDLDNATRMIAQKAIQAFFEDEFYITAMQEGLQFSNDDGIVTTLEWHRVALSLHQHNVAADAFRKWLSDEVKELDAEVGP